MYVEWLIGLSDCFQLQRTDLLSYVLFGFGLITFLVSILGLVGSYHRSKEFTFVVGVSALVVGCTHPPWYDQYSVSQMIVLAAETVVFFTVIWHMDLVQHNSAWTTPFTATFGTLQVCALSTHLLQLNTSTSWWPLLLPTCSNSTYLRRLVPMMHPACHTRAFNIQIQNMIPLVDLSVTSPLNANVM